MTIVAVVGGGQLARMMAPVATEMGITLRVLVESATAAAAAAAHETVVGMPSDDEAVKALLADPVPDVLTWEHEHIPPRVVELAASRGVPVRPGLHALHYAQDKIAMRERMDELGLPNPAWRHVRSADDVAVFLTEHGPEAVLKTSRGGYDGKGVMIIDSPQQAEQWIAAAAEGGPRVLIEAKVPFARELSMQVARTPSGEVRCYPLVESLQRDGVCAEVVAPARDASEELRDQAVRIGETIAAALEVTGMLAVELFERADGSLLINELAMRPHNSGHWSMDGAVTGQFEQHLRAVLDWPLGDTAPLAGASVMVNILGGKRADLVAAWPGVADAGAKVHLYGKDVRPGRKVGHVTVIADDAEDALARARAVADWFRDGE